MKGKNEADAEEMIKLLNLHLTQPEKQTRRVNGRRGPRTRSVCVVSELEKLSLEKEENNNNETTLICQMEPVIPIPVQVP